MAQAIRIHTETTGERPRARHPGRDTWQLVFTSEAERSVPRSDVLARLDRVLTEIDRHGGLAKVPAIGLADALDSAADAAYSSVGTPVEGTILTVARAAAAGAKSAAAQGARREAVSVEAVLAARTALATTHDQLPAAHEAGVVDAGGSTYG